MIQLQYMASWVPIFVSAMEAELAAKDNSPPFTAFQFATVNRQGFPHTRTLINRGWLFDDKTTNVLTFVTDKRTDKYQELMDNDRFEAVFYFEKSRKQFRLRGHARLLDDNHVPQLDLEKIQPRHIIDMNSQGSSSDDEAESYRDTNPDESDDGLLFGKAPEKNETIRAGSVQARPLVFPIISPNVVSNIHKNGSMMSMSFANLQDLNDTEFSAPSQEEWNAEILRLWKSISKGLKLSFRGPLPRAELDETNQKLIDKISRGVDGKKEESGMKNFAVVAMFIDHVDYFDDEKKRRFFYDRDETFHWHEMEVCP